jgi:TRAP-type C4-dicarboxylate transport system permease large subunit
MANDVPMIETFKRVLPFFLSDAVRFAIIIAFPAIEMFLPRSPEIS